MSEEDSNFDGTEDEEAGDSNENVDQNMSNYERESLALLLEIQALLIDPNSVETGSERSRFSDKRTLAKDLLSKSIALREGYTSRYSRNDSIESEELSTSSQNEVYRILGMFEYLAFKIEFSDEELSELTYEEQNELIIKATFSGFTPFNHRVDDYADYLIQRDFERVEQSRDSLRKRENLDDFHHLKDRMEEYREMVNVNLELKRIGNLSGLKYVQEVLKGKGSKYYNKEQELIDEENSDGFSWSD